MKLQIIGDIPTILRGELETLSPVSFKYALGGAGTLENLGETIIINGKAYVYTPQKSFSPDLVEAAFMVGFHEKPRDQHSIHETCTIDQLYLNLLQQYPEGFVLTGKVEFKQLAGAFLKESPTQGEPINELKQKYWGSDCLESVEGEIVGVCFKEWNPHVVYINPNEPLPKTFSHTHVLGPNGARHLLTSSSLSSAELFIEALQ